MKTILEYLINKNTREESLPYEEFIKQLSEHDIIEDPNNSHLSPKYYCTTCNRDFVPYVELSKKYSPAKNTYQLLPKFRDKKNMVVHVTKDKTIPIPCDYDKFGYIKITKEFINFLIDNLDV